MSRNRRSAGSVRGPASALTSFLAGLGVEPSAPLTWGDNGANATTNGDALAHDGPVITDNAELDPAGAVTARTVEAGPSTVADSSSKRRRSASIDSDDLDLPVTPKAVSGALKPVGEFMNCGECGKQFTVTAYTKPRPKGGYLCVPCCHKLGIDPFAKAKKNVAAVKKPPPKEARNKITHYEDRRGVNPLGDLCIQIIGKFIEDVDQLGDIGHVNMDKVCRIISRGRLLTPETAPLFYSVDRRELVLYDCTRLTHESYLALANLCPNIEHLRLDLCGQMTTDAMKHMSRLPLRSLELFGPFLVREDGWRALFESCDLTTLSITQSPRIDLAVIEHLVEHCPNLTTLRLVEFGKLDDSFLPVIARLPLQSLEISSPGLELSDDGVVHLISHLPHLTSLTLSHHPSLSDAILPAITKHCKALRVLGLSHIPDLTDNGVATLLKGLKHLEKVDLEKGHDLADQSLKALVFASGKSLEHLSILGWRDVSKDALGQLPKCRRLKTLDLGWCRQVTDFLLKDLLDQCPDLEKIYVWGCNQLSDAAPRKRGVQIIGIETHAI